MKKYTPSAEQLFELIESMLDETLSKQNVVKVLDVMSKTGDSPKEIVKDLGLEKPTNGSSKFIEDAVKKHVRLDELISCWHMEEKKQRLLKCHIANIMNLTCGNATPKLILDIIKNNIPEEIKEKYND
jgi:Asp-tRNA(Asn)/Glu-tRNA(Gln) amidotransferase B subunit